jgi:hypothetical protein
MNPRADQRRASPSLWCRIEIGQESRSKARFSTIFARAMMVANMTLWSVAATGCVGSPRDEVVSSVQFQDVVVPDGLRLIDDAHQSHSVEAANYRLGHFVYYGGIRREDAANYVRLRMPQHSWVLVADEVVDENTNRIRFVRGHYSAEYKFIRMDGRMQMVVDYQTDYTTSDR